MNKDPEQQKEMERRLAEEEKLVGHVPVVHQILSDRPEVLPHKVKHLIALGAAVAGGSPYCIRAQMENARMFGATEDEILEALQIASYMGLTRGQSISFRVFADVFGKEYTE